jgi:hypothetical protein
LYERNTHIIDDEGYFTCDTGITVDMWKTFLRDGKLMTPDRIDMLVKFYMSLTTSPPAAL